MIVIGADTHKRNHTLVALDGQTGTVRAQIEIAASDAGSIDALRFAAGVDEERVWAIEDCRHVFARLEGALIAAGERVIRVPAEVTGATRRTARVTGKSDPIDARAVALAVVRDGIDSFPVAFTDQAAVEIRVLSDYRDQIIRERVRMINRLRWHLVTIARRTRGRAGPGRVARTADLCAADPSARAARAESAAARRAAAAQADHRDRPRRTRAVHRAHAPRRRAHPAAACAARVRDGDRRDHHRPHRRRSALSLRWALCAALRDRPDPASSGNTQRHRLHRGGDRQLNRAIHIIALSRAKTDPDTRAYLDRKQAEGKTKLEAIRCLKRHLARRIWRLLYTAETARPSAPTNLANTDFHLT